MTEDRRYINSSDRLGLTDEEYEMLLQARRELLGEGSEYALPLLFFDIRADRPVGLAVDHHYHCGYIPRGDRQPDKGVDLTDEEYEMLLQARIDLYGSGDPLSLSLLGHGIDTAHRPRRW